MCHTAFDALVEYTEEAGIYIDLQKEAFDGIADLASMTKFDLAGMEVLATTTLARYEIINIVRSRNTKAQGS